MVKKKEKTERVNITLPHTMVADYREIAHMVGCSLSKAIRRRLEVRGCMVVVPEAVMEELRTLHELLDRATKMGGFDSEALEVVRTRVALFAQLVDFKAEAVFVCEKKKRRNPKPGSIK